MEQFTKEMFAEINRNREVRIVMDRIDRNLDCERLANRLNAISARRRKRDRE